MDSQISTLVRRPVPSTLLISVVPAYEVPLPDDASSVLPSPSILTVVSAIVVASSVWLKLSTLELPSWAGDRSLDLDRDDPGTRGLNNETPVFGGGRSNFLLSGSSSRPSDGTRVEGTLVEPGREGDEETPALPGLTVLPISALFQTPAGDAGVLERDVWP